MAISGGAGRKSGMSPSNLGTNLRRGRVMVNPFDLKTVFLAKHAQHVVLIHFPIALFLTAVAFDLIAQWTKRRWPGGQRLLQLAGGSDFNSAGSRNWRTRLAVPTRGPEIEGHAIAAPGTCVRLQCGDLAGLVGAFPGATADGSLAELPPRV